MRTDAALASTSHGKVVEWAAGDAFHCAEHNRFYHPYRGYFSNLDARVDPLIEQCQDPKCSFSMYIARAESTVPATWTFRCPARHHGSL